MEKYTQTLLLANVEEYKKKPYVLYNYIISIVNRKKIRKELIYPYLQVLDSYIEALTADEINSVLFRKALFNIEDNMKPGDPEFEKEREFLQ